VGKAEGCLPVGKNAHPRRDAKTPTPIALHASHPNLFITWVACAREMMTPNVFGCG
jgi:hypothetical protein